MKDEPSAWVPGQGHIDLPPCPVPSSGHSWATPGLLENTALMLLSLQGQRGLGPPVP